MPTLHGFFSEPISFRGHISFHFDVISGPVVLVWSKKALDRRKIEVSMSGMGVMCTVLKSMLDIPLSTHLLYAQMELSLQIAVKHGREALSELYDILCAAKSNIFMWYLQEMFQVACLKFVL